MLTGGCFCGAVRYEADGEPFHATWCHCADCRRSSGAPAMAWFSVHRADFRLTEGKLRQFKSSERAERGFCGDCGTSLTYEGKDLPELDVATATLDMPEKVPPRDHIWFRSHLDWVRPGDGLPQHNTERGAG
ncbi:GFA family protein [Pseudoroseomonas globiformis]|uniref:GFA family protein n=1 Tax=Teichococcus globiformis TaxID=2307229 RepID=A0ABV7G445_9PROT